MKWTPEMILTALETTALRRCHVLGHRLGTWTPAKHKMGQGAKRAVCLMCGKYAILSPNGYPGARNKIVRGAPGIRGDAVFEACAEMRPVAPEDIRTAGRLL